MPKPNTQSCRPSRVDSTPTPRPYRYVTACTNIILQWCKKSTGYIASHCTHAYQTAVHTGTLIVNRIFKCKWLWTTMWPHLPIWPLDWARSITKYSRNRPTREGTQAEQLSHFPQLFITDNKNTHATRPQWITKHQRSMKEKKHHWWYSVKYYSLH